MSFFTWLFGRFSNRGRALSFYKRGIRKSRNHDHEGAIDDYTTTIKMTDALPDVKALAHYHRALVHLAAKNDPMAINDLNVILAMKETMVNVKTMARQMLKRIEHRSTKRPV